MNVATPLTAATLVVLPTANPPGPLATEIVTVDVSVFTTVPLESSTSILMLASPWPAVPVEGCWAKANMVAASIVRFSRHSIADVLPE